jgi:hypothetical protein
MQYDCSSFGLVFYMVESKETEQMLLTEDCGYLAASLLHSWCEEENSRLKMIAISGFLTALHYTGDIWMARPP